VKRLAKILFVWELGGGFGHLARIRPIALKLAERGYQLFAAMNDVTRTHRINRDIDMRILQAPLFRRRPANYVRRPPTFAHILHNIGFCNEESLAALTGAWHELYDLIRPDLVVFDHSPTALLASRGLTMRRVVIGSGFFCPPDVDPLPRFQPGDETAIRDGIDRVLSTINGCLASRQQPPLDRVLQFYREVDDTILTTFSELDHFGARQAVNYWGAWTHFGGVAPNWPEATGPRVFGYLKRFKALPALLEHLLRRKLPSLLVIDGVTAETCAKYQSDTLRLASAPLDISQAAGQCDLAVLNGTHGTAVAMLLAGKPSLHIPLFLEQAILARSVVRMGAGLCASPNDPRMIADQFDRVLASDVYRKGAIRFAGRYADFDPELQIEKIVARLQRLLPAE